MAEDHRRSTLILLDALARDPAQRRIAASIVVYLLQVLDEKTMESFRVMLASEAPVAEGLKTTYAETLLERGRQQGLERGRQQGLERGMEEGQTRRAVESVLMVLRTRGLPISDEQRGRIEACRELAQLDRWLRAAVSAETTDDIFG